jgi:hypothetical protein
MYPGFSSSYRNSESEAQMCDSVINDRRLTIPGMAEEVRISYGSC